MRQMEFAERRDEDGVTRVAVSSGWWVVSRLEGTTRSGASGRLDEDGALIRTSAQIEFVVGDEHRSVEVWDEAAAVPRHEGGDALAAAWSRAAVWLWDVLPVQDLRWAARLVASEAIAPARAADEGVRRLEAELSSTFDV